MWAAVSPHFEDHGGVFLGEVGEATLFDAEKDDMFSSNYVPHAYDEASEERLWKVSCETVGVSPED